MIDKACLRKTILDRRKTFTKDRKDLASENIINQLTKIDQFIKAQYVGLYYPKDIEIDLRHLIEKYPNKVFAYPKLINDRIEYIGINSDTILETASFGLLEPKNGENITDKIQLFLVPALGMTSNGYRLGFGKGYFDKFFTQYRDAYKIGIIFENEVVEFKHEKHDVPLDLYIMG